MSRHVKRRWETYFQEMPLSELTRQDLKGYSQHLADAKAIGQDDKLTNKKLAPKSINRILTVGTIALKCACENDLIETDPGAHLPKFAEQSKRRGILTDKEVKKTFAHSWEGNPANRLGSYLFCQTGLRLGEVVGLRVEERIVP